MKTIRYYFFGTCPKNMDDCVDYFQSQTNKGATVSVTLGKEERATEQNVVEHFFAQYVWTFRDGVKVQYKKSYGGVFDTQSLRSKIKAAQRSNKNLNSDLERLASLGVSLEKSSEVFEI